jgi:hypothetical protein
MGMVAEYVSIEPLDEGFIVHLADVGSYDTDGPRRIAEPTLQGALTLAARALGYRGVIRFDDDRTVEVPVRDSARADFAVDLARAMCPHIVPDYTLPEGPILTQAYGLGPGPAVDDDEPPLRAGTAIKPDDLL